MALKATRLGFNPALKENLRGRDLRVNVELYTRHTQSVVDGRNRGTQRHKTTLHSAWGFTNGQVETLDPNSFVEKSGCCDADEVSRSRRAGQSGAVGSVAVSPWNTHPRRDSNNGAAPANLRFWKRNICLFLSLISSIFLLFFFGWI